MSKAKESKKDYTPKLGTGFLNIADASKKTHKDSPDFFGSINIGGKVYNIGGWNKEAKEGGNKYISVNLDLAGTDKKELTELRKGYVKTYLEEKEKEENKGAFLMVQNSGSLHRAKEENKEDMFGTLDVEGEKVSIKAFAFTKDGTAIMRLEVSNGMRSKEERNEITEGFLS